MFEYQLTQFNKVNAFEWDNGENWYQYEIANYYNHITGYRSGTKEDVLDYVNMIIEYQNRKLFINSGSFVKQELFEMI